MTSLKTILMGSAAAISLAAAPAISQETTTETDAPQTQQQTGETAAQRSYDDVYGEQYAGLGDRTIDELVGTDLVNDAGETIGQIDDFGLAGDELVAIVSIGGFLGMGEHSVAMPLDRLTYDGEQLVISDVTREELEALPAYNQGDSQTFASDQTFRSGYEGGAGSDTAAVAPSDDPAADQPMADAEEQVAEAEAEAQLTAEDQMAQTEEAVEDAGEDVAQAAEDTGEEVAQTGEQAAEATGEAGEEVAQAAEETGEAVEGAGEEATSEVAEAGQEMADEAEQMAESAEAEVTEETDTAEAPTEEPQQAETETAQTEADTEAAEPETETAQTEAGTEDAAQPEAETAEAAPEGEQATEETEMASEGGWTEEMDSIFSDIADRQIAELIGMEVAGADGSVVGEVDNFALDGDQVVAIVGIGGFLGIGEHEVALSLGDMTYDGEKLVLSSMTEEQLREMPEYEATEENYLPEDGTLRSTYNQ